jgi:hypothetical protein
MTTSSRLQRRYDHRLGDLVHRTGDLTIATDLGVPRSTARGWLAVPTRAVVSVDAADLTEQELRQEILKLRQRVDKLAALLLWLPEGQSGRQVRTFRRILKPPSERRSALANHGADAGGRERTLAAD